MSEQDIRDQVFEVLAENADSIESPSDDEYGSWVHDIHQGVDVAASDFALRYVNAHQDSLGDKAAQYRDTLATAREEIKAFGDSPSPETVLTPHDRIRGLKADIENLGEECMILGGEQNDTELFAAGHFLAEEAERCWNTQSGGFVNRYVDEDRRDPMNRETSLEEATTISAEELESMVDEDIPLLLDALERVEELLVKN